MWKVLGEETLVTGIEDKWTDRVIELSKRKKDKERFLKLMKQAQVRYIFDAIKEIHTFIITLPPKTTHSDLEFLKTFTKKTLASAKEPVVEFDGVAQNYSVVFTSEEEKDEFRQRRGDRTKWWEQEEKRLKAAGAGEESSQSF